MRILDKVCEHKWIFIFSLIMFVAYLSTLSCSFDDEDSLLFHRGIEDYNVAEYRPHPPGYPVYIFFGKISRFFIKDDLLSMTVLSAVFGALSLIVFYFLISKMFNWEVGLMSSMIMGVTPLFWLNSLKAMTDMTALFFILLSMYYIYSFIKERKMGYFYVASFVSAVAVGVRFHALFVVVPLLIYSYFKLGSKKKIFYSVILFLLGVLVWFVPMVLATGIREYFSAALSQFLRRFSSEDMAVVGSQLTFGYVLDRVRFFLGFFVSSGYGIVFEKFSLKTMGLSLVYLFFFVLVYGAIVNEKIKKKLKNERLFFFMVGLVFYVVMIFLFLPTHNPRYLLPVIPFFSLLFALGVYYFGKFDFLIFLVLFVLLISFSFPSALEIHREPSAPTQAINYIKMNYDLDNVYIFGDYINSGHFRYYDIEFFSSCGAGGVIGRDLFLENKTVLFVGATNMSESNYNMTLIRDFSRDMRVHAKGNSVSLYEVYGLV